MWDSLGCSCDALGISFQSVCRICTRDRAECCLKSQLGSTCSRSEALCSAGMAKTPTQRWTQVDGDNGVRGNFLAGSASQMYTQSTSTGLCWRACPQHDVPGTGKTFTARIVLLQECIKEMRPVYMKQLMPGRLRQRSVVAQNLTSVTPLQEVRHRCTPRVHQPGCA